MESVVEKALKLIDLAQKRQQQADYLKTLPPLPEVLPTLEPPAIVETPEEAVRRLASEAKARDEQAGPRAKGRCGGCSRKG